MTRQDSQIKRCTAALALLLTVAVALADESLPFREEIDTPHWDWCAGGKTKPLTALFLTNSLAGREPEELSQRFPSIKPLVVPVSGDAYKNSFDEKALLAALGSKPDLMVVAAREALRDLSSEARNALTSQLKSGTPLLCFYPDAGWRELAKESPGFATGDQFKRLLPWNILKMRDGKINVMEHKIGSGKLFLVNGFDLHWTFPTAFEPTPYADFTYDHEIALALAARLVFYAAEAGGGFFVESLELASAAELGGDIVGKVVFNQQIKSGRLCWTLYSAYSEKINSGVVDIDNAVGTVVKVASKRGGKAFLCWSLESNDGLEDFGALELDLQRPATFDKVTVPEFNRRNEAVDVSWTLKGDAAQANVTGDVYDADDRLMGHFDVPASQGKAVIPPWMPAFVTHELRLRLTTSAGVADERRVELNVQADRSADAKSFKVTLWDNNIYDASRWRLKRLRQLGVTAVCPPGDGRVASNAGLRLAAVNVCVPPNRFNYKFNPEERVKKLADYSGRIAKYSPLGYSLADEPNLTHWPPFRNWAAEIIHRGDKNAPVGFCGAWLGAGGDPRNIECCDYLIAYSPHDLYTPNLWLGVERDILRSFVKPGTIYSCWTQYCPWKDNEPYSRTMPWLLLFEGANGVAFFGGGGYAIITSDLRTTHETRWWNEEVKRLHDGVGDQLIAMSRPTGDVRILFPGHQQGVLQDKLGQAMLENWARAFNESGVPYKFITCDRLEQLERERIKLLICPVVPILSERGVKTLEKYVRSGGIIVVNAPTGILSSLRQPGQDEFWKTGATGPVTQSPEDQAVVKGRYTAEPADVSGLFGFKRSYVEGVEVAKIAEQLSLLAGVPLGIVWSDGPFGDESVNVASGGDVACPITAKAIGEFSASREFPDYLQPLVKAPAVLENTIGEGKAFYLNFSLNPELMRPMINWLEKRIGFQRNRSSVIVNGQTARNVYLYPMSGCGIEMLGVIQDYVKTPPTKMNQEKETSIYFQHGPELWDSSPAELTLPESRHIYDARLGRYLGHGKSSAFTLQAGRPELFALLPYQVVEVKVNHPGSVKAGGIFKIEATVITAEMAFGSWFSRMLKSPVIGDHVVNFQLIAPDGTELESNSKNVMLKGGKGFFFMQLPLNAQEGKWQLAARDAVTGTRNVYGLNVESANPAERLAGMVVKEVPLDWKTGVWQERKEDNSTTLDKVDAKIVNPLSRHVVYNGPWNGKQHLTFSALLQSRCGSFGLCYLANNDHEAMGWTDKRQALATMGGLGVSKPAPHIWYYNGFFDVYFDDKRVTEYAVNSVKEINFGDNAGIEVEWDSPHGKLTGDFMMELNQDALFVRLTAAPSFPAKQVTVRMRGHPNSFNSLSKVFTRTPKGKDYRSTKLAPGLNTSFALYGCDINDPAFGKGMGPGGLHLLPDEWDAVAYGSDSRLEKNLSLSVGQAASFHFALRLFPKTPNDKAYDIMRDSDKVIKSTLSDLYKVPKAGKPAAGL